MFTSWLHLRGRARYNELMERMPEAANLLMVRMAALDDEQVYYQRVHDEHAEQHRRYVAGEDVSEPAPIEERDFVREREELDNRIRQTVKLSMRLRALPMMLIRHLITTDPMTALLAGQVALDYDDSEEMKIITAKVPSRPRSSTRLTCCSRAYSRTTRPTSRRPFCRRVFWQKCSGSRGTMMPSPCCARALPHGARRTSTCS